MSKRNSSGHAKLARLLAGKPTNPQPGRPPLGKTPPGAHSVTDERFKPPDATPDRLKIIGPQIATERIIAVWRSPRSATFGTQVPSRVEIIVEKRIV